jgi:outer membrane protein OmpA-like peptidoglycan-associated protein/tetratricopeptide (TPR) repeat protein
MKKFIITLFIALSHLAFAQNIEFVKDNFKDRKDELKVAIKNLEKGDAQMARGTMYYKLAIDPYLEAQKFNPNNAQLNLKIGQCYLYSNFKIKAIPFLEKAYTLNNTVSPDIHFLLGQAYHLDLQWDKAISEYKIYLQTLNPKNNAERIKEVEKRIEECNTGKELQKNPIRVRLANVGGEVNSKYADLRPLVSADESVLIFTSRRPDGMSGDKIDPLYGDFYDDIYFSTKKDGKWTAAKNIGKPINTVDHDANAGFSVDGQKLLLYMVKNGGDIYESVLKGESWSKPERLNKNINSEYHESSAWYSPDGKQLYFVSDKPGGYGERDIYVSTLDAKGKWGQAVNLGPEINTEYNEEAVYMHPDGKTLYFSSQGHNTMGGYDIFKSVYDENKNRWGRPQNIGYPVNTPGDDIFLVLSASGKHGYYSSFSTTGFGDSDIMMITFLGPEKQMILDNEDNLLASRVAPVKENIIAQAVEIKEAQLTILKGVITDALSKKPLEAAIDIIDNEKNQTIATFNSNSATGKYLVTLPAGKNYGIAVKKENYLFHSENFDIPATSAYQEIVKDIALNSIAIGSKIILKNIFFDLGKATLRPESVNELERLKALLTELPGLKIEISGHTDSRGSDASNQLLSENRAKAVVDYLIKNGIAADRLTYKGYGKNQPIAPNDTEANMQLNRRTEFKVTGK